MSQQHPIVCPDCEREFDAEDGEILADDELRCFDCCDNERALFKLEQLDQKLDDPRRF